MNDFVLQLEDSFRRRRKSLKQWGDLDIEIEHGCARVVLHRHPALELKIANDNTLRFIIRGGQKKDRKVRIRLEGERVVGNAHAICQAFEEPLQCSMRSDIDDLELRTKIDAIWSRVTLNPLV